LDYQIRAAGGAFLATSRRFGSGFDPSSAHKTIANCQLTIRLVRLQCLAPSQALFPFVDLPTGQ